MILLGLAFSMFVLLVVIAITAALIGLVLPAVHRVRASAVRAAGLYTLKQIAMAMHNYHAHNDYFMHARLSTSLDQNITPMTAGTPIPNTPLEYATSITIGVQRTASFIKNGEPGWNFYAFLLSDTEKWNLHDKFGFPKPIAVEANHKTRETIARIGISPGDQPPRLVERTGASGVKTNRPVIFMTSLPSVRRCYFLNRDLSMRQTRAMIPRSLYLALSVRVYCIHSPYGDFN